MRNPGRQLLERDVREAAQHARTLMIEAALDGRHPAALEQDRIDVPSHGQVVAQHDRMASLLGSPSAYPCHPCPVALAELAMDEAVIARQVVLGQEPDLEGG